MKEDVFLNHATGMDGEALPLPNVSVAAVHAGTGNPKLALRGYQEECIQAIAQKHQSGTKRVILCLPTGAGKTVTFSEITRRTLEAAGLGRILILVDRIELLYQAAATLRKAGLEVGLLKAGVKYMPSQEVVVAMVETYYKRVKKGWSLPDLHLIIIDEAHKGNFRKVIDLHPDLPIIGATATPVAASKHDPLKDYFEDIVIGTEIHLLIEAGYLATPRYFAVPMEITASTGYDGEYKNSELYTDFNKPKLYRGCVSNQQEHALGKKTVIFCVNIAHTQLTAQAFREVHEQVRTVTSYTSDEERQATLQWFAHTPDAILVNCGILTTGFDEPSIECIILNRATQSLPLYLQMCGRGSRTTATKEEFIIIDMGNNILEHGLWHVPRDWSYLFHSGKPPKTLDIAPTKECTECHSIIPLGSVHCPYCGWEFERLTQEKKESQQVQTQELTIDWSYLKQKSLSKMSVTELMQRAQLGNLRTGIPYKPKWVLFCIMERENPKPLLQEYAHIKGYRPGWVDKFMQEYAQMGNLCNPVEANPRDNLVSHRL
ncbi:DEAD/DEAH box helicase family protein [Cytophagaceae bacterium DM2B3-1]|uniref:DEAD/DEAH box helicase family protein n=1 Tax=Xanthocytophaga flava TaxID=3048013 RepID=A0ABT7CUF0_9BACT|nr:DEAD/DEAH box helicase family protein [Xanthocytophaga flavus]MDJ1497384.1 DEAD/DEAH box helicase family protein [Xanthocytophaga flavus]